MSNNLGIAVISLLFASTTNCPRLIEFAEAQALIMWMADLLLVLSKLPRSVLPSIAITWPSVASWSAWIQLSRHRSNSAGDSIEKIALNRSCEGIRQTTFRIIAHAIAQSCQTAHHGAIALREWWSNRDCRLVVCSPPNRRLTICD